MDLGAYALRSVVATGRSRISSSLAIRARPKLLEFAPSSHLMDILSHFDRLFGLSGAPYFKCSRNAEAPPTVTKGLRKLSFEDDSHDNNEKRPVDRRRYRNRCGDVRHPSGRGNAQARCDHHRRRVGWLRACCSTERRPSAPSPPPRGRSELRARSLPAQSYQCRCPGGHQTTSPARISTISSPSHCAHPTPVVTISV